MSSTPDVQPRSANTGVHGGRQAAAGWPARLWIALRGASRRRWAAPVAGRVATPLDFALAMRRVEHEVYDAA